MSMLERVGLFAAGSLPMALLFYPVIFLFARKMLKETLPTAGHVFGFFSTWTFTTIPGYLFGQGYYDWHPSVILITPAITAILGVAIALSLFGEKTEQIGKNETKKAEQQFDKRDEKLFARAWDEVENQNVKKGLWAKAFADAGGDNQGAKSIYIELRVKQLNEKRAPSTRAGNS